MSDLIVDLVQGALLVVQENVWIFMGAKATFPSAVFQSTTQAEEWIRKYRLTGVLTQYPVGISVLDWVMEQGLFSPKPERLLDPSFVGRFSSAYAGHFHYEDGMPAGQARDPTPSAAIEAVVESGRSQDLCGQPGADRPSSRRS